MAHVEVASFNVFGIHGRAIEQSVGDAMADLGLANGDLLAVAFQEVWRRHQLQAVRRVFLGEGSRRIVRGNVDIWFCPRGAPFRCLAPRVKPVRAPGFSLELSSGLATCVRGRVVDRFFQRYRGRGAFPDNLSNKGVLAALVATRGRRYAVLNTHMHDSKNDAFGGARGYQIEQLANVLHWIERHWLGASVVLLGDFNIDTIEAVARTNKVTTTLYAKLLQAARAQRSAWFDVNARVHRPPVSTLPDSEASAALDHHLLTPASYAETSYVTLSCGSDHLLTKSRWSVP